MLNGFVSERELTEVVSDHVSLYFHIVPVLASIDIDNGSDHFGNNDAVSEVGLDSLGLFTIGGLLSDLLELLDESIVSLMDAMSESSSLSGLEELHKLVSAQFKQLLKLDTSIGALLEGLFLLLVLSAGIDLLASLACHMFFNIK